MTKLAIQNWENEIICTNDEFPYIYYKELVDKYIKIDSREINFQNRIVIRFLEKLFINTKGISIVDVSMQYHKKYKKSKIHDTSKYSSRQNAAAPPDLLIARNWNFANKNNEKIDYLMVIEIKSPVSEERIYNKKIEEYKAHTINEVSFHLEANRKVILTDCIRWQFFKRENKLIPIKTIDLFNGNPPDSIREDNPDEWKRLCEYIRNFSTE